MADRILVVEDDPQMREVLVTTLEDEGYRLQGVGSATEALELAHDGKFELFITDVRLPGMDGLDYLLEMRSRQPSMRAIVITGYAHEDAPSRAILAQADDYLYKPFSLSSLLAAVARILSPQTPARLPLPERLSPRESWMELSRLRDRVFRGYFVGIRSALLDVVMAWRLWHQLEALESEREALWRQLSTAGEEVDSSALRGGYQAVLAYLIGSVEVGVKREQLEIGESLAEIILSRTSADSSDRLDRKIFERLFRRVRNGELAPEMLMVASSLRQLPPPEVKAVPELQELYWAVWES
ncbi:MAG: response regulator [Armatimonadetes bacterium]|nr:response regulator [Armatimonadota bacterium]